MSAEWLDRLADLEAPEWWTSAQVALLDQPGEATWRVSTQQGIDVSLAIAPLEVGASAVGFTFEVSVAKASKAGTPACLIRLQTKSTTGQNYWDVVLDPHSGAHSLPKGSIYGAGLVTPLPNAWRVKVACLVHPSETAAVDACLAPVFGPNIHEFGEHLPGAIDVFDLKLSRLVIDSYLGVTSKWFDAGRQKKPLSALV